MANDLNRPSKSASVAKEALESATSQAQSAADQMSKVGTNIQTAIDKSLSDQPYATLFMAVGAGFLLGALWKS
jgi:ElaB/YqjD/DUF883 family membrane-anchored ribosome-binding protein